MEFDYKEALAFVRQERRRRFKAFLRKSWASLLLAAFFLFLLLRYIFLGWAFPAKIDLTLDAGVYVDGVRVADTIITIDGSRTQSPFVEPCFVGTLAVDYIPITCRDGVTCQIGWRDIGSQWIEYMGWGSSAETNLAPYCYINRNMTVITLKLEDGTVIATDESYVPLAELDLYYALFQDYLISHSSAWRGEP